MRTRLSTEQRRDQLLAIGSELFAQRPYDQVSIEEVAEIARISTGLLYRYFPSKRAFFVAIVELESGKLLKPASQIPSCRRSSSSTPASRCTSATPNVILIASVWPSIRMPPITIYTRYTRPELPPSVTESLPASAH